MTRDEVIAYIQQVHFGYLATVGADNAPRVRPVGIYNVYGDDLYWFTLSNTRKVAEIEANPQVEVVWCKLEEQSQVRIRGKMVVEEDEAIQQQFREDNPIVANLLPKEAQYLFRLYKLQPEVVEVAKGMVPYTEVDW
ncbi:MAG: pyridoxamine 5'-phosphate oxidase family protein [Chloroflexota bacterium]|nr:pyridoxamine 5'-phosphate oxidase family protein [Chloroflexota bacterium]